MPAWIVWDVKLETSWLNNIQSIRKYLSTATWIMQKLVICNAMQINWMILIDIQSLTWQGLDFFEINRCVEGGGEVSLDSPSQNPWHSWLRIEGVV